MNFILFFRCNINSSFWRTWLNIISIVLVILHHNPQKQLSHCGKVLVSRVSWHCTSPNWCRQSFTFKSLISSNLTNDRTLDVLSILINYKSPSACEKTNLQKVLCHGSEWWLLSNTNTSQWIPMFWFQGSWNAVNQTILKIEGKFATIIQLFKDGCFKKLKKTV